MPHISGNPTNEERAQVLRWLPSEYHGSDLGSASRPIERGFDESRIHCVVEDGQAIAFALFEVNGTTSSIPIFQVHPSYQRRGIGTLLVTHLLSHLRSLGA